RVHEVFPHGYERGGAAGREIETAEQLLPARLGRKMQFGGGDVGTLARPSIHGCIDPFAVNPEARAQRFEEGDTGTGGQFVVAYENLARERDPRGFAAPGQQFLTQFDQALRTCRGVTAPIPRAIDQRAATLRNGLEHLTEKRGVHTVLTSECGAIPVA